MLNVEKWMKELLPFYREPGKVECEKTALLIIDMENYFASPSGNSYLSDTKYMYVFAGPAIPGSDRKCTSPTGKR